MEATPGLRNEDTGAIPPGSRVSAANVPGGFRHPAGGWNAGTIPDRADGADVACDPGLASAQDGDGGETDPQPSPASAQAPPAQPSAPPQLDPCPAVQP